MLKVILLFWYISFMGIKEGNIFNFWVLKNILIGFKSSDFWEGDWFWYFNYKKVKKKVINWFFLCKVL